MPRLHLLVEGQTEEIVARDVVAPHLASHGWTVSVSILATKHPAGGAKVRGGVRSWDKVRREVGLLLRSFDVVTTMIDYYGFPDDSPGMSDRPAAAATDRVRHVEHAVATAIGDPRFVPHLTLHETEAWVFAAADALAELVNDQSVARELRKAVEEPVGRSSSTTTRPPPRPSGSGHVSLRTRKRCTGRRLSRIWAWRPSEHNALISTPG
jgi:hypothetical protein